MIEQGKDYVIDVDRIGNRIAYIIHRHPDHGMECWATSHEDAVSHIVGLKGNYVGTRTVIKKDGSKLTKPGPYKRRD